jgi:hypothetical protein
MEFFFGPKTGVSVIAGDASGFNYWILDQKIYFCTNFLGISCKIFAN